MHIMLSRLRSAALMIAVALSLCGQLGAQGLFLYSGEGQVVQEQFRTTAPLVVQARDGAGNPVAGVEVAWTITQAEGTLVERQNFTDGDGLASIYFIGTQIPIGLSVWPVTVTASSAIGRADFHVTTAALRLISGAPAQLPLAELVEPPLDNPLLTGAAGSTLAGAVKVQVTAQSASQAGKPVPNVGVRIINAMDPDVPISHCSTPLGIVLTDANGTANCDLVLGSSPGSWQAAAVVGEFRITRWFRLEIEAGTDCTYSLSPSSQSVSSAGGSRSVLVNTGSGCSWSASSGAGWLSNTGGSSGIGTGTVSYTVAPNPGASRSASLFIAGKTFQVTQGGSTAGTPPSITTGASLPSAAVGEAYAIVLAASGGQPPYQWSAQSALPEGLALNSATGALSGVPTKAGTGNFSIKVTDSAQATASSGFTLVTTDQHAPPGGFAITTSSLPDGSLGEEYLVAITTSGGCVSPFNPVKLSVASGSVPPGLELAFGAIRGTPVTAGLFSFQLRASDSCGAEATRSFAMTIAGAGGGGGPEIQVSPAALEFVVRRGDITPPPVQSLAVTADGPANFTVSATTVSGGNWLAVTPSGGDAPTGLTVTVSSFSTLAPGSYTGTITVTPASGTPVTVPVALTVTAPRLQVNPASLLFTFPPGSEEKVAAQAVEVSSMPSQNYTVTARTLSGGQWLSASAARGTTPDATSVQVNTTDVLPGTHAGVVEFTAGSAGTVSVPVTLIVQAEPELQVSPLSLTFTFEQGVPPPGPRLISVASSVAPLSYTLETSAEGPIDWLFASPSTGITPVSVAISVNPLGLEPGVYRGSVRVDANGVATPADIAVELRIVTPPPSIAAVTNAASGLEGPVSPGEIITVWGFRIGPAQLEGLRLDEARRVATILAGTRVLFDGVPVPLVFVRADQLAAIVPYWVDGRSTVTMQVEYQGVRSAPLAVMVAPAAPGIFTIAPTLQAAALNEDGSVNSEEKPAEPGSVVVLFATGEGQTAPEGVDGMITGEILPVPVLPVDVYFNGTEAEIRYAGAAPTAPSGALQVNALLPKDVAAGAVTVLIKVGDRQSQGGVTIWVR